MTNDLEQVIRRSRTVPLNSSYNARSCVIAITANDTTDRVEVTYPFSSCPATREVVVWRLAVDWDGTHVQPRWPTRGQPGITIEMDTGEQWLIY